MKKIKKIILLLLVLSITLVFNQTISNAANILVTDDESLRQAIQDVQEGQAIELTENIELKSPIEISDKKITINGNGHTISRKTEDWTTTGPNATLITAGGSANVTLNNLTLSKSEKYGVQAYNGGYVTLNNVIISDCEYGGVLINAGTVEVIKLHLGHNGLTDSNNGIEIAKSSALSGNGQEPKLVMNGTLSSTEKENVVRVDIDDPSSSFEITNTENTENKVLLNDNNLVVVDENNIILYNGGEVEPTDFKGEVYIENVTVTIKLNDKTVSITLKSGQTLSNEQAMSAINLTSLGLENYTLEGLYSDEAFTTAFNFSNPITGNTTIYAKLNLIESQPQPEAQPEVKDETPKTGLDNHLEIAILIIAISSLGIIVFKNKEF